MIHRTTFRRRVFVPALKRAGISGRVRVHDLRHTAAALAIDAGVHPKQIQAMLGHANIEITMDTYGHLFESSAANAADALDEGYRASEGRQI